MKTFRTTIELYVRKYWSPAMTVSAFLERFKDDPDIEAVRISEVVTVKEAVEILTKK